MLRLRPEDSLSSGARTGPAPALAATAARTVPASGPASSSALPRARKLTYARRSSPRRSAGAAARCAHLRHREAREQALEEDALAKLAESPPLWKRGACRRAGYQRTRAAQMHQAHGALRAARMPTSSLLAVPGGPSSSRCSPHSAASSNRRTCAAAPQSERRAGCEPRRQCVPVPLARSPCAHLRVALNEAFLNDSHSGQNLVSQRRHVVRGARVTAARRLQPSAAPDGTAPQACTHAFSVDAGATARVAPLQRALGRTHLRLGQLRQPSRRERLHLLDFVVDNLLLSSAFRASDRQQRLTQSAAASACDAGARLAFSWCDFLHASSSTSAAPPSAAARRSGAPRVARATRTCAQHGARRLAACSPRRGAASAALAAAALGRAHAGGATCSIAAAKGARVTCGGAARGVPASCRYSQFCRYNVTVQRPPSAPLFEGSKRVRRRERGAQWTACTRCRRLCCRHGRRLRRKPRCEVSLVSASPQAARADTPCRACRSCRRTRPTCWRWRSKSRRLRSAARRARARTRVLHCVNCAHASNARIGPIHGSACAAVHGCGTQ